MPKDYYVVLGISRGANLNKIKRAYRKVVKEVHPDVTGSEEDAERFREVKEAYETLADEARRSAYDRELSREGSPLRVTRVPQRVERRRSFMDEMNRAFSTLVDDFFEGFVPGFYPPSQKTTGLAVDECVNDVYATARCRPEAEADNRVEAEGEDGSYHEITGFTRGLHETEKGRIRDKDLYYEAVLSPTEADRGGLYPVRVPVMEPCPQCSRSGLWDDFFCPACLGYGRVQTERQFSLSIPPHVSHGTRIRVSMEDIGLRGVSLNVVVRIDPDLDADDWE